jgi:hypothetical protein
MSALMIFMVIVYIITSAASDVTHAMRGMRSPRMQARDRRWDRSNARRDADKTGAPPIDSTHRIRRASGGYIAGIIEDALDRARESGIKRGARRKAKREFPGPTGTTFNPTTRKWTVVCDRCGWASREYSTEPEANQMRDVHAKTCTNTQAGSSQQPVNSKQGSTP